MVCKCVELLEVFRVLWMVEGVDLVLGLGYEFVEDEGLIGIR